MRTARGAALGPSANQSMCRVEPGWRDTRTKEPWPPTLRPPAPPVTEPSSALSSVDLPTLLRPSTGISVHSGSSASGVKKSLASPR